MWWKKIKQKKHQFLLSACILCFTALIFMACIAFTVETNRFTKEYFAYDKCPIQFNVVRDDVDLTELTDNPKLMEILEKIAISKAKFYDGSLFKGKNNVKNSTTIFYELDDIEAVDYKLTIMEGDPRSSSPGDGEIWFCTVGATANNVVVGDQVSIGKTNGDKLTVSAIVSTPICPSGFMGVYPYYVNEKTLNDIDGIVLKTVNFHAKGAKVTSEDLNKMLPKSFMDARLFNIDSDALIMSTSMLTNIFGGIGMIAAFVIFMVSVVIIRFIIKSTIAKEMKIIGTYKSLGFTTTQIIGFYLKCYLLSGLIGITVGTILGIPLASYIGLVSTRDLGGFHLTSISMLLAGITILILLGVLVCNVFYELRKIKKITPVQAMQSEMGSSKEKLKKSLIKNAYAPLTMAVNDIFRKKGMSIMIVFILTVSFYLSTLFACVNYTLKEFKNNKDVWFAFPSYDCILEIKADEEVEAFLKKSKYVDDYTFANLGLTLAGSESDSTSVDLSNISVFPYSKLNDRVFDISLVEGRIPQNPYEINVSLDFLKTTNLKVGEYFNLTTNKINKDLLITGSYSSMYNGGKTIVILEKDFKQLELSGKMEHALIFLKHPSDYELFQIETEQFFDKSYLIKELSFIEPTIKSLNSIANPITSIFVFIFVLFSILNIVNLLLMNNIEHRKQYGVLKAVGFTNQYICQQGIFKLAILSGIAIIFTIILHHWISPMIFRAAIGVDAFESAPLLVGVVNLSMYCMILFTTYMFTLPLKKIRPIELMEE